MLSRFRTGWRRDLLVALIASLLTGGLLVSVGLAALAQQREQAQDAQRLALAATRLAQRDAAQARDQTQRVLVDQAADVLATVGGLDKAEAEAMRVVTDAVAPEVPQGTFVLIDKKPAAYTVGDIIVFRAGENNYLARVLAVVQETGRLTVGRNREADRQIAPKDVIGRAVLNTR